MLIRFYNCDFANLVFLKKVFIDLIFFFLIPTHLVIYCNILLSRFDILKKMLNLLTKKNILKNIVIELYNMILILLHISASNIV